MSYTYIRRLDYYMIEKKSKCLLKRWLVTIYNISHVNINGKVRKTYSTIC